MVVELDNISVQYDPRTPPALHDVHLTFSRGEFVCVLGRSGAGKSTLIRTINGLQPIHQGEIYMDETPLTKMSKRQVRLLRRQTGVIFQHFHLIPRMSVFQNVLTGRFGHRSAWANLAGWFTETEREQAETIIDQVGLKEMQHRRVEYLSGGQKQRVGIARALIQDPDIFLGDEPVASLDPATAHNIFDMLKIQHEQRNLLTIINVHDFELAKHFATRIIGLKDGCIVYDGGAEHVDEHVYEKIYGKRSMASKRSRPKQTTSLI